MSRRDDPDPDGGECDDGPFELAGHPRRRERREAPGDHRAAQEGVLDGARDGDELPRQLDQPGRGSRAGDRRVARAGHPGGARPRAEIRAAHQGAVRRRARLARLQRRAVLPAAARAPDRHRPRDPRRDRGRDRRDRALQPHHRGDRRRRLGHAGHGHRRSSTTRRATVGCSRATCASTRRRASLEAPRRGRRFRLPPATAARNWRTRSAEIAILAQAR